MIKRTLLVAAATAVGISAVMAQDIIAERQALMKRSSEQSRIGAQMIKGQIPFDLDRARTIFKVYLEKAQVLPKLFPKGTEKGDTRALPAIWEKQDEWKGSIEKFARDAKAGLEQTKDLETFRVAFTEAARNCGACHKPFRRP